MTICTYPNPDCCCRPDPKGAWWVSSDDLRLKYRENLHLHKLTAQYHTYIHIVIVIYIIYIIIIIILRRRRRRRIYYNNNDNKEKNTL